MCFRVIFCRIQILVKRHDRLFHDFGCPLWQLSGFIRTTYSWYSKALHHLLLHFNQPSSLKCDRTHRIPSPDVHAIDGRVKTRAIDSALSRMHLGLCFHAFLNAFLSKFILRGKHCRNNVSPGCLNWEWTSYRTFFVQLRILDWLKCYAT